MYQEWEFLEFLDNQSLLSQDSYPSVKKTPLKRTKQNRTENLHRVEYFGKQLKGLSTAMVPVTKGSYYTIQTHL